MQISQHKRCLDNAFCRSIWERALEVDYRSLTLWLKYAEMEMKNKFVNHARNVWDRAVSLLPRVDQLWYKYIHMEEMLGNVAGARQASCVSNFVCNYFSISDTSFPPSLCSRLSQTSFSAGGMLWMGVLGESVASCFSPGSIGVLLFRSPFDLPLFPRLVPFGTCSIAGSSCKLVAQCTGNGPKD
jgi:hypothetical protein